jgi:hypothetical protein
MIPAGVQVYVAATPVDFRKGAIGLMALVRDGGVDPFNGALYVFRSKRAQLPTFHIRFSLEKSGQNQDGLVGWVGGMPVCQDARGDKVLLAEDCADPGPAEPRATAGAG